MSGRGLGSERGKMKSERTRKAESFYRLRGNRVFCLFKVSSKFKMLSFVFIYFLLEFQPDSKPIST